MPEDVYAKRGMKLPPIETTKSGTPKPPSMTKTYAAATAIRHGDWGTAGRLAAIDTAGWDSSRKERQQKVNTKYNLGRSNIT